MAPGIFQYGAGSSTVLGFSESVYRGLYHFRGFQRIKLVVEHRRPNNI